MPVLTPQVPQNETYRGICRKFYQHGVLGKNVVLAYMLFGVLTGRLLFGWVVASQCQDTLNCGEARALTVENLKGLL